MPRCRYKGLAGDFNATNSSTTSEHATAKLVRKSLHPLQWYLLLFQVHTSFVGSTCGTHRKFWALRFLHPGLTVLIWITCQLAWNAVERIICWMRHLPQSSPTLGKHNYSVRSGQILILLSVSKSLCRRIAVIYVTNASCFFGHPAI